jgi:hypothetical protein
MGAWQPIATAPKQTVAGSQPNVLVSNGRYVLVAWWNLAAEAWYNTSCHRLSGQPTHWQPLPAPPAAPPGQHDAPAGEG